MDNGSHILCGLWALSSEIFEGNGVKSEFKYVLTSSKTEVRSAIQISYFISGSTRFKSMCSLEFLNKRYDRVYKIQEHVHQKESFGGSMYKH